ncbi:hypothetical protein [Reichenbachiella sp.]|uniref:hypothetical protein n=1 Tax=Reichenbachiella sp. TaxID=2184521 RepID=UPI003B5AE106
MREECKEPSYADRAVLQFIEIATERDTCDCNWEYYQDFLKSRKYDPDNFTSNAIKLAAMCIVRETHVHLPQVRVLSALMKARDMLRYMYDSQPFTGSSMTGLLPGWRYANMLVDARITYQREVTTTEHCLSDIQLRSLSKMSDPVYKNVFGELLETYK